PGILAERRLVELQLRPFNIELARLRLRALQLDKQAARLVLRVHQRQRADHQQGGQRQIQAAAHAALPPGRLTARRWATRSTAERARGLAATSSSDGLSLAINFISGCGKSTARIGNRRSGCGTLALPARKRLTIRSSSEWKLITTSRP